MYNMSFQLSLVVQLNVGGHLYTTSLGTLRKYPDSKLAELFSGQPKLPTDAEGRYFVDRDGRQFRAVLEFLRSDLLPTEDIQKVGSPHGNILSQLHRNRHVAGVVQVHAEALYYNIRPLIKHLEESPQLFGELVGRQQFLSRLPHYRENIEVKQNTERNVHYVICRNADDEAVMKMLQKLFANYAIAGPDPYCQS